MNSDKGKKKISVNDYVNVKDIKKNYIYTKDNYIIGFLKVPFVNIALLNRNVLESRTNNMKALWKGDKKKFNYISLPRELDLDQYKGFLKDRYANELENLGRRKILSLMILEGTKLSTSGENFEHLQYVKVWEPVGNNLKNAEDVLRDRMIDYKQRYDMAGTSAEVLSERELIILCNLFSNSAQAAFEVVNDNLRWSPITLIAQ